jgi:tetratricopeptide (TPR) repeat protein
MTEALILTIVSLFLGLGLVPAVAVVASRLKGSHCAGRRVMLKWAQVQYGDLLAEGTFLPVGTLEEAVVVVARRQGDWLATAYGGETVWFPLEAAVLLEQAPDYFRGRIRDNPADIFAWHKRGLAWQALGQPDRAIKDFTEVLRLEPRAWGSLIGRGNAWLAKQDHARAVADFSAAIEVVPDLPLGYLSRAGAWSQAGDLDKVIADCTEAIRVDPDNVLALNNRGHARLLKQDTDGAIKDFDAALCRDPQCARSLANRAYAWLMRQQYDRAIADADESLRLDPTSAPVHVTRARAWAGKLDYQRAEADCTAALRLDPDNAEAYLVRGGARAARNKHVLALADYGMAARRAPNNPWPHLGASQVWAARKDYGNATDELTEALRLEPNNAITLNGLAWIHATCPEAIYRDGPRAVEYAFRACDLTGWKLGSLIDTLGAAYAEAGEFEQAVQCQEQALNRPDFPADKHPGARERIALYTARRPYRD